MSTCKHIFLFISFQVLVEFDDRDWTRREWIKINEIFHVFLVENTLHWALRTRQKLLPDCDKLPSLTSGSQEKFYWPALVSLKSYLFW